MFRVTLRHCICMDGSPVRTVVRNGCRSQLLIGPWSLLSRHVLKSTFSYTASPPPKPSLKLKPARARLNTTLWRSVVCAVLAWKNADDCLRVRRGHEEEYFHVC